MCSCDGRHRKYVHLHIELSLLQLCTPSRCGIHSHTVEFQPRNPCAAFFPAPPSASTYPESTVHMHRIQRHRPAFLNRVLERDSGLHQADFKRSRHATNCRKIDRGEPHCYNSAMSRVLSMSRHAQLQLDVYVWSTCGLGTSRMHWMGRKASSERK